MVTLYQDAKRRGIYLALEPTLRAIVRDIFSTDKPNFLFLGICWCSYFIYRYDFIFQIGHETRSHFESRPEKKKSLSTDLVNTKCDYKPPFICIEGDLL